MLLDRLDHYDTYASLGLSFQRAFAFLRKAGPEIADGRYDLSEDGDHALAQSYETGSPGSKQFEAHRAHIDIQYLLSGRERVYYQPIDELTEETPYNDEKDVTFFGNRDDRPLLLNAGDFLILWPQDGHKPGCSIGPSEPVRKIVVKLRIHRD